MTRFFLRLLNYTLIACFLAAIWGGWYASNRGFGRKWRKKLSEEFARRGVEMTTRRLTLDPLRGLVAHEARIFRDSRHRETVAVIDELRLDINYTRLLRAEPFLDAIRLSEADVNLDFLPLKKGAGETRIQHLSAEVYFRPGYYEIRRLNGRGMGMDFSISGIVDHPLDWQLSKNSTAIWHLLDSLDPAWWERISQLKFHDKTGRLDLRLRGNLAQIHWLQSATGNLKMPWLEWRGIIFKNLGAHCEWAGRTLTLRELKWKDAAGQNVSINGNWNAEGSGNFAFFSKMNPGPLLRHFPAFADWKPSEHTSLAGTVSWDSPDARDWQVMGTLDARGLRFRDRVYNRVQTQFSGSPHRWLFTDFRLTQNDGAVTGRIFKDGDQLRLDLVSTVDPKETWPENLTGVWLAQADFPANPWVKLELEGPLDSPQDWKSRGEIVLGRTIFRGVSITSGQADFSGKGLEFTVDSLQLTRPEGQLTAAAIWKPDSLVLTDVKNSIDLGVLGRWLDKPLAEVLKTIGQEKSAATRSAADLQ